MRQDNIAVLQDTLSILEFYILAGVIFLIACLAFLRIRNVREPVTLNVSLYGLGCQVT